MPDLLTQINKEWPAKIFHIYGTTEIMCPLYNPDPVGQHLRLRPGFYCQTRIIDIGGTIDDIVTCGEEGELIVDISPDQMFSGYLNQPKATAKRETIASVKLIFIGAINKPTAHVKITNDMTRGFIKLKKAFILLK